MNKIKYLTFLASIGIISNNHFQVFGQEKLIAHADVLKTVEIQYKFQKNKIISKKKVLSNGKVIKTKSKVPICKRVKIVKDSSGVILKRKTKKGVECPTDKSLYNQKRVFRNHRNPTKGVKHFHNFKPEVGNAKPNQKIDDNSCKEGSIIGGLLGAGITMSTTRGKDRWWAVPAGGTAGALIGCQIDGG